MFGVLLRPHAHRRTRQTDRDFEARSSERDARTDQLRVSSILTAIENALSATEQERSGLDRRVEDALARAAVTIGNGADEYLEREPIDSHYQDLLGAEICNGQRRLKQLAAMIVDLRFLKTTVLSRFPEWRPPSPKN